MRGKINSHSEDQHFHQNDCKIAFTLAEVLITLGIIGVVAALTLPTLIQNYQKQVYVTQLKKTYATLSEGFKQIAASEGCTTLKCSTGFDIRGDVDTVSFSKNETLREKIVKEFKLSNIVTGNSSNTSPYDFDVKSLSKNESKYSDIFFSNNDLGMIGSTPQGSVITFSPSLLGFAIIVDTNGLKQPNTIGRDIFIFVCIDDYNDSVIVTPLYSSLHIKWLDVDIDEKERIEMVDVTCSTEVDGVDGADSGITCAEKIIMDGWKMNY